jgi:7-cyano-7-deazaguanine synthase
VAANGRLLLCSGGADSTALLLIERAAGRRPDCLFFDYGQLAAQDERRAAQSLCAATGVALHEVSLRGFPPSGLTDEGWHESYLPKKSRFFLPMRNGVFLTLAVSWAMHLGCTKILIGSVHADRTHLDSGPDFLAGMTALVGMASGGTVAVEAPLADLPKAAVAAAAAEAGAGFADLLASSWSCYHPRASAKVRAFAWGEGCGSCLSCRGRRAMHAGLEA